MLDYEQRKKLLESYGFTFPEGEVFASKKKALESITRDDFPLVAKLEGDIAHKTEKEGVKTNLSNKGELEKALNHLFQLEDKVLVQSHIEGVELVIGGKNTQNFGPVVMFGIGGILIELLEDVTFRVAPIEMEDGLEMIDEIQGEGILDEFRGGPKIDREKLSKQLVRASQLIFEKDLEEMDINPLIAIEDKFYACDVKIYD